VKINEFRVTKKDIKKYIKHPYTCPRCGSESLAYERCSGGDSRSFHDMRCNDCKLSYAEIHELIGVEINVPYSQTLKIGTDPTIKCHIYDETLETGEDSNEDKRT